MLPNIKVTVLGDDERECTLRELCAGKVGVIDLWHTKCQKCPAGLDKFNAEAEQFSKEEVLFVACALSLGSGNKEDVAELGPETWDNVAHAFIEEDVKDQAKAAFGYTAVPFYVVFDKNGSIIKMGDSKAVDYVAEVKRALEGANENAAPIDSNNTAAVAEGVAALKVVDAPAPAAPAHVFTLDEDF